MMVTASLSNICFFHKINIVHNRPVPSLKQSQAQLLYAPLSRPRHRLASVALLRIFSSPRGAAD